MKPANWNASYLVNQLTGIRQPATSNFFHAMRIAIIVDTFPSLSETFISNKVSALASRGHTIQVFCNKVNKTLLSSLAGELAGVRVERFNRFAILTYLLAHPLAIVGRGITGSGIRQKVLRAYRSHRINRQRPDIIHFEFSGIGIEYLAEMAMLRGSKVVSCRGTAEKVKLLLYPERQTRFRQLMQQVDAVHCVSEDMRQTILPYCNRPEKIFINRPSINLAYFSRERSRHAQEQDTPLILSVGRMTFQKGHLHGLYAMKQLQDAGIAFNWVIVGQGNKFEELVFKTRQLGMQSRVKLIGSGTKQEVRELMEQATVFFLPSVYEGIANVVLEAMSMELPVVSTRCGGMDEVITHDVDGLLAGVYDHTGMAAQLMRVLGDPSLRSRLARNARFTIEQRFTLGLQTTVYEAEYLRLCRSAAVQN